MSFPTSRRPHRHNRSLSTQATATLGAAQASPPAHGTALAARVTNQPFSVQQTIYALCNVNLRQDPGYVKKPAQHVIGVIPRGATIQILAGPTIADRLIWWQALAPLRSGKSAVGWVAQAAGNGVQLLGTTPAAPPTDGDPLIKVPDENQTETATDSSLTPDGSVSIHLARPFTGTWRLTQGWGKRPAFYAKITYGGVPLKGHNGLDFGTPEGTELLATANGTVKWIRYKAEGFGNYLILQHEWGESLYAHLSRVDVTEGTTVAIGQCIGLTGNTGLSSAPHLHFGIRIAPYRITDGWGGFSDPTPFLAFGT